MTAREYLEQALSADMRIESCGMEAESCRELAGRLRPFLTGGDCPAARSIRRLQESERKADSEAAAIADMKAEVMDAIGSVPDPAGRQILMCRYIGGMTWRQIGKKLHADESTVRHRHDRALGHIKTRMPTDTRMQTYHEGNGEKEPAGV